MQKQLVTIIADEDVIDELACFPSKRCLWISDTINISDEEFERIYHRHISNEYQP